MRSHRWRRVMLLTAALGAAALPAMPARADTEVPEATEIDAQRLEALREARRELERARLELERAARELAASARDEKLVQLAEREARLAERQALAEFLGQHRAYAAWLDPERGMLGVIIGPGDLRDDHYVGNRILGVTPGSGAEDAGLRAGDLIVGVDGKPVEHPQSAAGSPDGALPRAMGKLKVGQTVKLDIVRDGKPMRIEVIARHPKEFRGGKGMAFALAPLLTECACGDDSPATVPPAAPGDRRVRRGLLGLELASLDADLASYFKSRDGVLVLRAPDSGTLGLRGGDVILRIDGAEADSPRAAMEQLARRAAEGGETVVEVIRRGKRQRLAGRLMLYDAGDADDEGGGANTDRRPGPAPDGG